MNKLKALEDRIKVLEEKLKIVNAKANHIYWSWSEDVMCEECGSVQHDSRRDCPISGPYIYCKICGEATYHFRNVNTDNEFLDREYNTIKRFRERAG